MADEPAGREAGGAGVVSIGCGSAHSLALLREGALPSHPQLHHTAHIMLGCGRCWARRCAHATDYRLWVNLVGAGTPRGPIVVSFGRGEDGQLGQGDAEERLHPTAVLSLQGRGVTSVHCGAEYSVAVASGAQQVYSWGELLLCSQGAGWPGPGTPCTRNLARLLFPAKPWASGVPASDLGPLTSHASGSTAGPNPFGPHCCAPLAAPA